MAHDDEEVLRTESGKGKTVIMLHGRGATAHSIMQLEKQLPEAEYIAPQARNNTWYPESFMAPVERNQPYLDSALKKVHGIVQEKSRELGTENIFLLGFSQGACLASEYVARNPKSYGGLILFSGGLIGEDIRDYRGNLEKTPVFIGCSEKDPHIPLQRVNDTEEVFKQLNGVVNKHIFDGSAHTVTDHEITAAENIIRKHTPI